MFNLLEKAKTIFTSVQDQKTLDEQAEYVQRLEDVKSLMDSDGGEVIKKWIKDDVTGAIRELFDTKSGDASRETLIARLKIYFELLNKLNVQADLDAIEQWLQDKLEE